MTPTGSAAARGEVDDSRGGSASHPEGDEEASAKSVTPRVRLNREIVVRAALELIDVEGLDALSMRKLGAKLGKDTMAVYRHAHSRDDVLEGVTELLLDQWIIPRPGDLPSWQDQLRNAATDFRALVLEHRHVVPLLVTRPLSTPMGLRPPGAVRPLERILDLLMEAGFAPADAMHAYRAYYGYLIGHILNELEEFVVDADEDEIGLKLGLHRLAKKDFPRLRQLAPLLLNYDGEAELNQGIAILLEGLQTQLHPVTQEKSPEQQ